MKGKKEMKEFKYVISRKEGLHAKQATLLSKKANELKSRIFVFSNGVKVDATRIIAVIALGVRQNTEIMITVEGSEEHKDLEEMKKFMEENF